MSCEGLFYHPFQKHVGGHHTVQSGAKKSPRDALGSRGMHELVQFRLNQNGPVSYFHTVSMRRTCEKHITTRSMSEGSLETLATRRIEIPRSRFGLGWKFSVFAILGDGDVVHDVGE